MQRTFKIMGAEKLKMNSMTISPMSLHDWLLRDEAIRFSVYDAYSKSEIVVTNKRIIFYRSGLAKEELEAYNLNMISSYHIDISRKIGLLIIGILLTIIGSILFYQILTFAIKLPIKELAIIPFFILIIGVAMMLTGLIQYPTLELVTSGKKTRKTLKLPRRQLIELAKTLHS